MVNDIGSFLQEHLDHMVAETLLQEVAGLRELGHKVEIIESDGVINLVIEDFPLPPYYNKKSTTLLLRLPVSYPNGNPDMFWTDADLMRLDGQVPTKADQIETYSGKQWRRFSWHPQGWKPGTNNLCMYLEFVSNGLNYASKNK